MQYDGWAESLGAFYKAHRQELFTYALSITKSASGAEDAVHDAFSGILRGNRAPAELRPYVFRCVRNASLDVLRAVQRERDKAEACPIFRDEISISQREAASEFLALLSEHEREIVVLKIYSGLTFKEIAAVCGIRQGTAAASYWRSLQKLRGHARAEGENGQTPLEQRL